MPPIRSLPLALVLVLALAAGTAVAQGGTTDRNDPGYPWNVPVNLETGLEGISLSDALHVLASSVGLTPILEGVPDVTVNYDVEVHRPFGQLWVLVTGLHGLDSLLLDGNIIVVAPEEALAEIAPRYADRTASTQLGEDGRPVETAPAPADASAEAPAEAEPVDVEHRFYALPARPDELTAALTARYPGAQPIVLTEANSLLILASAELHEQVAAFLADYQTRAGLATLDDDPAAAAALEPTTSYYPVDGDPSEVVTLLTAEHPDAIVTALPSSGLVAVQARPDEQAIISEKLNRLTSARLASTPEPTRVFHPVSYSDPDTLVETVRTTLGGGEALAHQVALDPSSRTIVLSGTPDFIAEAQHIVERLDRQLAQVTVQVRFQEVSTEATERLGINLAAGFGLLSGVIQNGLSFVLHPASRGVTSFNINATLDALEAQNLSRQLRDARLTLTSGQEGTFTSGGRIDLVMPAGENGEAEIRTIEYGTLIDVTPIVTEDGKIRLDVSAGISGFEGELGTFRGLQLSTREIDTSITLENGQALLVGGLIENTVEATESGVPILKDIPLIGNLFRSTTTSDRSSDVMIVVRADYEGAAPASTRASR